MNDATPYSVPQEPGRWRALILAALVHLALLAFLWIGVRWQNQVPTTIEAEVWSPQPQEAAPLPQPEEEPQRAPEPKPQPVVKETPREMPKPEVKEAPVEKPDIALEQEKKRKALEKKRLEEEQAKQKKAEQEREAKLKKEQEERQAKKKEEEKQAKKKEEERQTKLEADKKRAEKEKADKDKKAAEAKRKQQEAEDKLAAKIRADEMRRLTGATGTGGHGDAPKSQGGRADSGYAARVSAKIKSNIVFNVPDNLEGNPPVEYEVNLLPDGSIAGIKKLKSSGLPGFDEAVRRGIEKSQPYPRDKSGSVPSSFIGSHRPKD